MCVKITRYFFILIRENAMFLKVFLWGSGVTRMSQQCQPMQARAFHHVNVGFTRLGFTLVVKYTITVLMP